LIGSNNFSVATRSRKKWNLKHFNLISAKKADEKLAMIWFARRFPNIDEYMTALRAINSHAKSSRGALDR
jgi:hypothetical protein